ncbi:MAG: hypothetical protein LBD55_10505 [Treponema sp.]|nr:hypothetical protein [Treponema sp.]
MIPDTPSLVAITNVRPDKDKVVRVVLPGSITSINQTLLVLALNAFNNAPPYRRLRRLGGSVDDYRAAPGWSTYAAIIEAL